MKKRRRPSPKLPMRKKVRAGCYIDFEGFAANEHQSSPPPVLIGVYNLRGDGLFKQVIFTNTYRWAAEDAGVDHEVIFDPDRDAFLNDLVSSVGETKPLFAFSEHELRVIQTLLGIDISRRYRNVRAIASRWLKKQGDTHLQPKAGCLRGIAAAMGIELQSKLPKNGVTKRLRQVREYSSSANKWSSSPAEVRRKWRELLHHNRSDVMAINEIMLHMRPMEVP